VCPNVTVLLLDLIGKAMNLFRDLGADPLLICLDD
jgi:hypothetical protein